MIKTTNRVLLGCLPLSVLLSVPVAGDPETTLKDPTRPLQSTGSTAQAIEQAPLQLSAIYMRSDAPAAVINGRMLQRGDSIEGITITRIESGRVHFTGRQSGVLNLYPAVIKRKL